MAASIGAWQTIDVDVEVDGDAGEVGQLRQRQRQATFDEGARVDSLSEFVELRARLA